VVAEVAVGEAAPLAVGRAVGVETMRFLAVVWPSGMELRR